MSCKELPEDTLIGVYQCRVLKMDFDFQPEIDLPVYVPDEIEHPRFIEADVELEVTDVLNTLGNLEGKVHYLLVPGDTFNYVNTFCVGEAELENMKELLVNHQNVIALLSHFELDDLFDEYDNGMDARAMHYTAGGEEKNLVPIGDWDDRFARMMNRKK